MTGKLSERGLGDKVAIVWEGEPGEVRRITYTELRRDVCRFANALTSLGVRKGDRVVLYMPMVPEGRVSHRRMTNLIPNDPPGLMNQPPSSSPTGG